MQAVLRLQVPWAQTDFQVKQTSEKYLICFTVIVSEVVVYFGELPVAEPIIIALMCDWISVLTLKHAYIISPGVAGIERK